ncbi:MAG: protein phosphatase 2C domain-containing protein, partial [Elusimicrobiota bacterium]
MAKIIHSVFSHKGMARQTNQDYYLVDPERGMFFVCDGMGGANGGDVVGSIITRAMVKYLYIYETDDSLKSGKNSKRNSPPGCIDGILKAVTVSNALIYKLGKKRAELHGMGSTLALFKYIDGLACIVNVGDSRIYRVRENNIEQLTVDHSWVSDLVRSGEIDQQKAQKMSSRNVVNRVVGVTSKVALDYLITRVNSGDTYVICSDGLYSKVEDHEILASLKSSGGGALDNSVSSLVELANKRGGEDNITVIIVKIFRTDDELASYAEDVLTKDIKSVPSDVLVDDELVDSLVKRIMRVLEKEKVVALRSINMFMLLAVFLVI